MHLTTSIACATTQTLKAAVRLRLHLVVNGGAEPMLDPGHGMQPPGGSPQLSHGNGPSPRARGMSTIMQAPPLHRAIGGGTSGADLRVDTMAGDNQTPGQLGHTGVSEPFTLNTVMSPL